MKHLFIAAATLLATATMSAQSYNMKVTLNNGDPIVISADNISEVTFETVKEPSTQDAFFATPANTYMVTSAGDFSFYTKKVNGSEITGINDADWIWYTKQLDETSPKIIENISYDNGVVSFSATGKKGIAVIGVFDKNDKCLWGWTIWCTDTPNVCNIETEDGSVKFLDRGIGAYGLGNVNEGIPQACYQWGRPVPFFGGFEIERDDVFGQAKKWTVINSRFNYTWGAEEGYCEADEPWANPTTMWLGTKDRWSWTGIDDSEFYELWSTDKKTDNDPTPAGYSMTDAADWAKVVKELVYTSGDLYARYDYNGTTFYIPSTLGRAYDNGEYMRTNYSGQAAINAWNGSVFLDTFWFDLGMADAPLTSCCRINVVFENETFRYNEGLAAEGFALPVFLKKL